MKKGHKWHVARRAPVKSWNGPFFVFWGCFKCGTTITVFNDRPLRKRHTRKIEKCKDLRNVREVEEVMDS